MIPGCLLPPHPFHTYNQLEVGEQKLRYTPKPLIPRTFPGLKLLQYQEERRFYCTRPVKPDFPAKTSMMYLEPEE